MVEKIIIAGAGGQGVMLLGKVLAEAAMREAKFVTWFPSYGAEVRGGTAYCMVIISDEEIGSPYIEQADSLIIMNEPSLARFKQRVKNKGRLLVNSSLVKSKEKEIHALFLPFTDAASKLGNIKVANIVALGCYIAKSKVVGSKTVLEVIEAMAPENRLDLIEINKKALSAGMRLSETEK